MERIDSEERKRSSHSSGGVMSHTPSVTSISDAVFESDADKDTPSKCAIDSTESDKMEISAVTDGDNCDKNRSDCATAGCEIISVEADPIDTFDCEMTQSTEKQADTEGDITQSETLIRTNVDNSNENCTAKDSTIKRNILDSSDTVSANNMDMS